MIASLSGILRVKNPTEVLIEVNGVGYAVNIPLSTYEKLGNVNSSTMLFTHLHVREDVLQLFGFATELERNVFRLLLSVSGIGPKIAQGILSGISVRQLNEHIAAGNVNALTAIPNVGRKTAERLILELREKVSKLALDASSAPLTASEAVRTETLLALTSLGYQRSVAEKAIRAAINESNGAQTSVEELIKRALRHTGAK